MFDEHYQIAQIYDKEQDRMIMKPGTIGNCIKAFEDIPQAYDAWEITNYYTEKGWVMDDVTSVIPYVSGARVGFTVTRTFDRSSLTQTITLDETTKEIRFDTEIDWKNDHLLVKTYFPLDINTKTATYDIQFGAFERPTHKNTSWDAARFEVCAQKFADLSEKGYGVALMNDCKYGYSAEGSTISLTMLKSATHPDPKADKCHHEFTYSLLPHVGDYRDAGVIEASYLLNDPLVAMTIGETEGVLPEEYSLLSVSGTGTIIETIKQAEDGDDTIVRLHDAYNMHAKRTLSFAKPIKAAWVCNMLERPIAELPVEGNQLEIDVHPYEILTLKCQF